MKYYLFFYARKNEIQFFLHGFDEHFRLIID